MIEWMSEQSMLSTLHLIGYWILYGAVIDLIFDAYLQW